MIDLEFLDITPDLLRAHARSVEEALDLVGLRSAREGLLPSDFIALWVEKAVETQVWIGLWAVQRSENLVLGSAGFRHGPIEGMVEIGYGVSPDWEGQGVATGLCGAMVAKAFRQGASVVMAHTLPTGVASQRVLLKNGFEFVRSEVDPEDGEVFRYERRA